MKNNVFIITDGQNFCGNGFIIRPGFAITNSHVLRDGGTHALINGENIKFYKIEDFRFDNINREPEMEDFALIQADEFTPNDNIEFRAEETTRFEELFILTYTNGDPSINIKPGRSNLPHGKFENTCSVYLAEENYVVAGNSGSPVVDTQNKVVGIFYGFDKNVNNAYFIKTDYLLTRLEFYISQIENSKQ